MCYTEREMSLFDVSLHVSLFPLFSYRVIDFIMENGESPNYTAKPKTWCGCWVDVFCHWDFTLNALDVNLRKRESDFWVLRCRVRRTETLSRIPLEIK